MPQHAVAFSTSRSPDTGRPAGRRARMLLVPLLVLGAVAMARLAAPARADQSVPCSETMGAAAVHGALRAGSGQNDSAEADAGSCPGTPPGGSVTVGANGASECGYAMWDGGAASPLPGYDGASWGGEPTGTYRVPSASAASGSGAYAPSCLAGTTSWRPYTMSWLEEKLTEWKPEAPRPLVFGGLLQPDSYGNSALPQDTSAVIEADRQMLADTGMRLVRIDMDYSAWLTGDQARIEKDNLAVARIRQGGMGLFLADAGAEYYRTEQDKLPWPLFEQAWVQRVRTLAALYHPEYYEVVKEPEWYYSEILDSEVDPLARDPQQWADLTAQLVQAVKAVSPSTRVGVAVAASELYDVTPSASVSDPQDSLAFGYLERAIHLSGLDFIGFDVYGPSEMANVERFLAEEGSGGKQIWIPEAWDGSSATPVSACPSSPTMDPVWIQVLDYFAERIGATGVLPFYTDCLASYAQRPTTEQGLISFYQQRTPVFYALEGLIGGQGDCFALGATPRQVDLTRTAPASAAVQATSIYGWNGVVDLGTGTLPGGISASFDPPVLGPAPGDPATAELVFRAGPKARPGSYHVEVTATSGPVARTFDLSLVLSEDHGTPPPSG